MDIFELSAFYMRGKRLKYEESFELGFFTDELSAAKNISFYLTQPGFCDLSIRNFRIVNHRLDAGLEETRISDVIDIVYRLSFGYDIDNNYSVGGTLGVFSNKENAEKMRDVYSIWDIFRFNQQKSIGGEFFIGKYRLNELHWKDGFV